MDVLENTLWNRQLGVMSEEIVAALVCQIFEGAACAWHPICAVYLVRSPNASCILSDDQCLFTNPAGQMQGNPAVTQTNVSIPQVLARVCHMLSGTNKVWPLTEIQSRFCIGHAMMTMLNDHEMAQQASEAPACGCPCMWMLFCVCPNEAEESTLTIPNQNLLHMIWYKICQLDLS